MTMFSVLQRSVLAITCMCFLFSVVFFGTVAEAARSLDAIEADLDAARLYRLGYPEDKTRSALRKDWSGKDRFETFVSLRREVQDILNTEEGVPDEDKERAHKILQECVNESLSGQLQMGNEQLLNAGRRKFPSVLTPSSVAQIRKPFDESDDWKQLALAALEFDMGIVEALDAVKSVPDGSLPPSETRLLRSRGGNETTNTPAEGFDNYTVIDQTEFKTSNSSFIRTELNLLSGILNRRGLAASGLVDRIRRLAYRANNEVEGRQRHNELGESRKEEFNRLALERAKRDGQLMFYSGLILRSQLPAKFGDGNRDDFRLHKGGKIFTAMSRLNRLYKDIRDGRPPSNIADQFVPSPNKRVGGQQGYLSDAITSVQRAKESQQFAESRLKEFQQGQVSEVDRNRNIREQYLTNLGQLTGYVVDGEAGVLKDPQNPEEVFDLKTPESRGSFLDSLNVKIDAAGDLLQNDAAGAQVFLSQLGSVGAELINRKQSMVGVELAAERVGQIPRSIERIESKLAAANGIVKTAAGRRQVWEYVDASAQTIQAYASTYAAGSSFSLDLLEKGAAMIYAGVSAAATLISAQARIKQNEISTIERVDMQTLDSEFQVKEILAGKRSAELELNLQGAQAAAADNRLASLRRQIEDLVVNLTIYRTETADLWFLDPSLEREKEDAEIQADLDLVDCLATLFDLTRALEFYWTEEFEYPILTIDGGIAEVPNFARDFTEIDDLYAITDAFDAEKYLNTVGFSLSGQSSAGWESTLRELRQSVPAQNQTVVLSLRRDILGFVVPERVFWDTTNDLPGDELVQIHENGNIFEGFENAFAHFENESITKFRDYLQAGRRDAFDFAFGTGRNAQDFLPGFEAVISTNEKSPLFFDAREWNTRLQTIQADVRTEGGFIPPGQEENFVRLSFIQEGTVKFRRSFPLELSDAKFDVYQTEFKYESDRLRISPYEFPVQASVNGSSGPFGGQPAVLPYFFSPICSNWRIVLDPLSHLANNYADINKIKDIRLILTVRSGIPPTLAEGL